MKNVSVMKQLEVELVRRKNIRYSKKSTSSESYVTCPNIQLSVKVRTLRVFWISTLNTNFNFINIPGAVIQETRVEYKTLQWTLAILSPAGEL